MPGSSLIDSCEDVRGADVSGCRPAGVLDGLRNRRLCGLSLDQATHIGLERLAVPSRAEFHRADGVVRDIPDRERGHESILAALKAVCIQRPTRRMPSGLFLVMAAGCPRTSASSPAECHRSACMPRPTRDKMIRRRASFQPWQRGWITLLTTYTTRTRHRGT